MKKTNTSKKTHTTSNKKQEIDKVFNTDDTTNNKRNIYVSYNLRLFCSIALFLVTLSLGILLLLNSFHYDEAKDITYRENGKADYRIYLKDNTFFTQPYLSKSDIKNNNNYIYVTSMIDRMEIDFDYEFSIDADASIDFDYKILADLMVLDGKGEHTYLEKQYELLSTQEKFLTDDMILDINETIKLDYDYYNDIATNFRNQNGVETTSYLKVYLLLNKHNNAEEDLFTINDSNEISVIIPLSEKSITIDISDVEISPTNQLIVANTWSLTQKSNLLLSILFTAIAIYFLIRIIRLLRMLFIRKNNYDKYIKKILTEYDRLIVETKTAMDFSNSTIIKIDKFEELLDVHDNLNVPIMYFEVTKHQKCYLYIKDNNNIYLLQLKAVDLEKK